MINYRGIYFFTYKTTPMKQFSKTLILFSAITAAFVILSSFNHEKKKISPNASSYIISFLGTHLIEGTTYEQWTWSVTNPNPGNGSNGTLQDISHWDLGLCPAAEAALVSAEYSLDGQTTWISVPIIMDRDPSIRLCTTNDVLKFDVGSSGTAPNYYRITFNQQFALNTNATSYIKTGGGLKGCNLYYYSGVGCDVLPPGTRND